MKIMHDQRLDEEKLSSERGFDGRLLHVDIDRVKLPSGRITTRETIKHPGAVGILPVHTDGRITLVKQYRYPVHSVLYEIPAGKLENCENITDCAKRELSEETGLTADEWTYLTSVVTTPGFTDEVIHLYVAKGLHEGAQHPDPDEFLDVETFTPDQVREMVLKEELFDAKSLSALLLYLIKGEHC